MVMDGAACATFSASFCNLPSSNVGSNGCAASAGGSGALSCSSTPASILRTVFCASAPTRLASSALTASVPMTKDATMSSTASSSPSATFSGSKCSTPVSMSTRSTREPINQRTPASRFAGSASVNAARRPAAGARPPDTEKAGRSRAPPTSTSAGPTSTVSSVRPALSSAMRACACFTTGSEASVPSMTMAKGDGVTSMLKPPATSRNALPTSVADAPTGSTPCSACARLLSAAVASTGRREANCAAGSAPQAASAAL